MFTPNAPVERQAGSTRTSLPASNSRWAVKSGNSAMPAPPSAASRSASLLFAAKPPRIATATRSPRPFTGSNAQVGVLPPRK